jgi:hypothetical protein
MFFWQIWLIFKVFIRLFVIDPKLGKINCLSGLVLMQFYRSDSRYFFLLGFLYDGNLSVAWFSYEM